MHCIRTLPFDDTDYSTRRKAIKITFANRLPAVKRLSPARKKKG
jgi:hypothetical protein